MTPLAWATVVLALATVGLAAAAWWQVPLLIKQMKLSGQRQSQWATIQACVQYDIDPTLYKLKEIIRDETKPPEEIHKIVKNYLNYLDSIAIGVAEKVYIEKIARDHMQEIIKGAVERYIFTNPPGIYCSENDYRCLVDLYKKWFEKGKHVEYQATQ